MNPWWLTFGLFAFGTVMLLIGFYNGHAMSYEAGVADGKMKANKLSGQKVVMSINHIDVAAFPVSDDASLEFNLRVADLREAKAEEPSDEDAAETVDNEIRHDRT